MGLVEVMMAVALSGGLALTVAKMMDNAAQNTKHNEARNETVNLKGIIQSHITNPTACKNTFTNSITSANLTTLSASPNNSVNVASIKNKINQTVYDLNSTSVRPLTITSITLTNWNNAASSGDLLVKTNFDKSVNSQNVKLKDIRIPINFIISGGVLTSCNPQITSEAWLLGGNASIDPLNNFIGTTDTQPLIFKINALSSGRMDTSGNLFLGYQTDAPSSTGVRNVALGFQSFIANTTGTLNVAIGSQVLDSNTTGSNNVGVGTRALNGTTTASLNTAIGDSSLGFNTSGQRNTAIGASSGSQVSSGNDNTLLGYRTGTITSLLSGSRNVFVGAYAGNSSTGTEFTGVNTANDRLYINNGIQPRPLIHGDFSSTGRWVVIDGNTSVGMSNTLNATATSPKNNLAVGTGNTFASGASNTFASGLNNSILSSSANSFTAGVSNSVNNFSFAIGHQNTVAGWLNVAIGQSNNLAGSGTSYAIGWNNTISSQRSYAIGSANNVTVDYAMAFGTDATSSHDRAIVFGSGDAVTSIGARSFTARFSGGYKFYTNTSGTQGPYLNYNASDWLISSDRNLKHSIKPIDFEEHLRKIAKLPVFHWKYKGQNIPHMGPMAQDFYYIFRLGDGDDKGIAGQDIQGVTLAGVKALEERTRKLQNENEELKKRVERLEKIIEEKLGQ